MGGDEQKREYEYNAANRITMVSNNIMLYVGFCDLVGIVLTSASTAKIPMTYDSLNICYFVSRKQMQASFFVPFLSAMVSLSYSQHYRLALGDRTF